MSNIIATIASAGAKDLLSGVGDLAVKIRQAITGDLPPDKKAELEFKAQELEAKAKELENQLLQGQIQTNIEEARSMKLFIAGWRPFIGWILGVSIGLFYIPQFLVATILWLKICWAEGAIIPFPIKDISGLTELILGMLGLAGLRTAEKFGKVNWRH